jgi:maleamate amidohydrolase
VVDALQHGYPPTVPREAVGDRNRAAHEANLYDIEAKYGDVLDLDEVLSAVSGSGATDDVERGAVHAAGSRQAEES